MGVDKQGFVRVLCAVRRVAGSAEGRDVIEGKEGERIVVQV